MIIVPSASLKPKKNVTASLGLLVSAALLSLGSSPSLICLGLSILSMSLCIWSYQQASLKQQESLQWSDSKEEAFLHQFTQESIKRDSSSSSSSLSKEEGQLRAQNILNAAHEQSKASKSIKWSSLSQSTDAESRARSLTWPMGFCLAFASMSLIFGLSALFSLIVK